MATTEQILKLRRKLQDFYDQDGIQLEDSQRAFHDDELNDLLDDAISEVSLGQRDETSFVAEDIPLAMLIARADGCLMIAQDESRRTKWEINNKVIDPSETPKRLIEIAKELRTRYNDHVNRKLKRDVEVGLESRPTGGLLTINPTVTPHYNRDFNNRDVRRNTPRR